MKYEQILQSPMFGQRILYQYKCIPTLLPDKTMNEMNYQHEIILNFSFISLFK